MARFNKSTSIMVAMAVVVLLQFSLATETAWETFLPTTALPKLTLAGFTWMAAIEFDPLAFTIPEQPLKNAEEELKITALAAHTLSKILPLVPNAVKAI